jgi:hypothetical protein
MRRTPLCWFASGWLLAAGGCLGSDLPSVVSQSSVDAAPQAPPPIGSSGGDVEDGSLANSLELADASPPSAAESGGITLTIGLPIDTATGQVASLGSLTVRLWLDGRAPRALTLELNRSSGGAARLNLENIAGGGPYRLDVTASAAGGVACAGSCPPFFVAATQTVWVLESLICGVDAGLASTLSLDPSP